MKKDLRLKIKDLRFSFQNGFTLLELLIVMAIIGILVGFATVNYISTRQRARDGKRKADLLQIQTALELYRADQGQYPTGNTTHHELNSPAECPTSSSFTGGIPTITYMQLVPCDPSTPPSSSPIPPGLFNLGNYYYYPNGTTSYTLAACLENQNDRDPKVQNNFAGQTDSGRTMTCTKAYVLTNP